MKLARIQTDYFVRAKLLVGDFVHRYFWSILYLLCVAMLASLAGIYWHVFFGFIVSVAGIYFLAIHSSQKKSLHRLSLWANILGADTEYPAIRIKWHSLALYSVPDYIAKKESIYRRIIVLLGIEVIYEYQSVLGRKKAQSIQLDDYGYAQDKKWIKEKEYFISQVILNELLEQAGPLRAEIEASEAYEALMQGTTVAPGEWFGWIDTIADEWQEGSQPAFDLSMTGHEYERHLAGLIGECGWHAHVTPGSGDHGADIIATKGNIRIAIQCKLYTNAVGNKSVQEAYSAKGYYDCSHACVITNSVFTPAARQAAAKLNIALLHHDDLETYLAAKY